MSHNFPSPKDGPGGMYSGSMPPPGGSQNNYKALNKYAQKGQIVLVGSSLMGQFPINELMMSQGIPGVVYNRAVGCNTAEYLASPEIMEESIFALEPGKLFLNIGTRDMDLPGDTIGNLIGNYRKLLALIKERVPGCHIHIIAFYPMLKPKEGEQRPAHFRTRETLLEANAALKELCAETDCTFVDLNGVLVDEEGYLRSEYAADAIHLTADGYYALLQEIVTYFG